MRNVLTAIVLIFSGAWGSVSDVMGGNAVGRGGGVCDRVGQEHEHGVSITAVVWWSVFLGIGKSLSSIPISVHLCLLMYTLVTFSHT